MRVLSFVNQKGGCGKTTAAVNLAGALAQRGDRVLLIDLDPQAHATLGLGCAPDDAPTLYEVLDGSASPLEALYDAPGGVTVLPATARLAEFEEQAERSIHPERALAGALSELEDAYDVVLLDCPPRVDGVLAANALGASDVALLVVETGAFALQGALQARRILEDIRTTRGLAFDVQVLGTLFDRRTRFAREVLVALQARFGAAMFDTVIRSSVRLREVAALGAPVQVVDPGCRAADDFAALADEVVELLNALPVATDGADDAQDVDGFRTEREPAAAASSSRE
jgi:chromosome partitioning protein